MGRHARPQPPLTEEQWCLVEDHLPLAYRFARRVFPPSDRRYADLEAACVDGLIYAARKWVKGSQFGTYAWYWVRRGLQLHLLRSSRLSINVFSELDEIGQGTGPFLFLRYRPSREPGPPRVAAARELVALVRRLVTPRQWEILYRRHLLEEDQREIGASWGLSSQRIGQLERAALARLRQKLAHHVEEVPL